METLEAIKETDFTLYYELGKLKEITQYIRHQHEFLMYQMGRMGRKEEQAAIQKKLQKAKESANKALTELEKLNKLIEH